MCSFSYPWPSYPCFYTIKLMESLCLQHFKYLWYADTISSKINQVNNLKPVGQTSGKGHSTFKFPFIILSGQQRRLLEKDKHQQQAGLSYLTEAQKDDKLLSTHWSVNYFFLLLYAIELNISISSWPLNIRNFRDYLAVNVDTFQISVSVNKFVVIV